MFMHSYLIETNATKKIALFVNFVVEVPLAESQGRMSQDHGI